MYGPRGGVSCSEGCDEVLVHSESVAWPVVLWTVWDDRKSAHVRLFAVFVSVLAFIFLCDMLFLCGWSTHRNVERIVCTLCPEL